MKNALIIITLFIGSVVFSQETANKYGTEFHYISFEIFNLTETEKQLVLQEFNNESFFKDIEITGNKSFSGYIHNDYINKMYSFFKDRGIQIDIPIEELQSNQTNDNNIKTSQNIPDDFPKYIDTGNPKIDKDNYYEAKQEWIKNNPERFEKIRTLNLDIKQ